MRERVAESQEVYYESGGLAAGRQDLHWEDSRRGRVASAETLSAQVARAACRCEGGGKLDVLLIVGASMIVFVLFNGGALSIVDVSCLRWLS